MGFTAHVRRHRILFVEAVVFSVLSLLALHAVSVLRETAAASPNAGGLAAIGALYGLVVVGVVGGTAVLTLAGTYGYRWQRGIPSEPYGPLAMMGVAGVSLFLVGTRAFALWIVGTALYFWWMCIYRWWNPVRERAHTPTSGGPPRQNRPRRNRVPEPEQRQRRQSLYSDHQQPRQGQREGQSRDGGQSQTDRQQIWPQNRNHGRTGDQRDPEG